MCLAPDRPKSDYTEIPKVEKSSCRVIYSRARTSEQAIDPAKDALQGVEPMTNEVRAALRALTRGPVLGLLIGFAIATAVILISRPTLIWEGMQEVELAPLIAALLLNVPIVLLRSVRAQVALRFLGHRISLRSMIPVQLVGQTSSTVTPAASGDYVRA